MNLISNRKSANLFIDITLVFVVKPILICDMSRVSRPFNFQNIVTDSDTNSEVIGPETYNLCSDMNPEAKSIGKRFILDKDQIALTMIFIVLFLPCYD